MIITLDQLSASQCYHLMTQTIIPRPIAWVLTKNIDSTNYNLAPFSYFTAVASAPPLIMLSIAPKDKTTAKDTLVNLRNNKGFVIHIADTDALHSVEKSATPLPYGESEVSACDLQLTTFKGTSLQRIKGVPVAFACRLYDTHEIGRDQIQRQTLVFAEITHLYINDRAVKQENERIYISAEMINPLSRLGSGQYAYISNLDLKKL